MERNRPSAERSLEGQDPGLDPGPMGGPEGGLKELVLKWFTETQVAGLTQSGHFPDWFHGFATRKDAEEQLKDKAVGVFLVRLSDKAIGYVLSYKGVDRCRHFVISQKAEGQFCISGDEVQHNSLSELIQHYKVSPIQPFGEFLTNNSQEQEAQEDGGDLYDVVNVNTKGTKSGVSVQALRSLWDQKGALITEMTPQTKSQLLNNNNSKEQAPLIPAKSTRRLIGSMSVDTSAFPQCIANEESSPGFLSTASSPDHRLQNRPLTPNLTLHSAGDEPQNSPGTPTPQVTYSSVVHMGNRSQSLPCLEQKEQRIGPNCPPKNPACVTYSLLNEELLKSNPLYEPAEALQTGSAYAEVGDGAKKGEPTYAGIAESQMGSQSNPYESLEELKTTKDKLTWGKHKDWKTFFTDYLKK